MLAVAAIIFAGTVALLEWRHPFIADAIATHSGFGGSREVVLPEGGPPDPAMLRASQRGAEEAARAAAEGTPSLAARDVGSQ
jgi:hypothetical protein